MNLILCDVDLSSFKILQVIQIQIFTYNWSFGLGSSPSSSNLNSNVAVSYSDFVIQYLPNVGVFESNIGEKLNSKLSS